MGSGGGFDAGAPQKGRSTGFGVFQPVFSGLTRFDGKKTPSLSLSKTSSRCFLSCQVFLYFWDNRVAGQKEHMLSPSHQHGMTTGRFPCWREAAHFFEFQVGLCVNMSRLRRDRPMSSMQAIWKPIRHQKAPKSSRFWAPLSQLLVASCS